jgi:WD40 repeat protein
VSPGHPSVAALVERPADPELVAHLATCGACRAQARLLAGLSDVDSGSLPAIDEARRRMADARVRASQHPVSSGDDEPEDLEPGTDLGRYTVDVRIGRGGMGTVYRVRHNELGSLHALKVLHRATGSIRDRLVREGRAQSRLRHPNVVPVTDVVDIGGAPGLILEYVDGPSLHERLREGKVPLDQADALAQDILHGVAAAHAAGIVHRDLKPGNVLLAPTGDGFQAKVTDFGLARHVDAGGDLTRSNAALGTPAYMSPEQVRDSATADVRSDVFSLGALLYELVSGKQAFAATSVAETFDRVRAGRYEPLVGVPDRMREAIAAALQIDPARRPADGAALLARWRSAEAPAPDRPRWWLVAAIAAAVVVPLGLAATHGLALAPVAPPLNDVHLLSLPGDLQTWSVAVSPGGESLAFTDGRGLWTKAIDGGEPQLLVAGGSFHDVDFFPDGERLLVSGVHDGAEGTWIVSPKGELTAELPRTGEYVRLSPDGTRVAWTSSDGLFVANLDGSDSRRVRPAASGDTSSGLAWSPSGEYLAVGWWSTDTGAGALEIASADGTSSRRLIDARGVVTLGMSPLAWAAGDTLLWAQCDDKGAATTLYALAGAATAVDTAAARVLHVWPETMILRLVPTPDGRRIAYTRATADKTTYILPVDQPTVRRPLTVEDWDEVVVGWRGPDEVLVWSERDEPGIYAQRLDAPNPSLAWPGEHVDRVMRMADGALVYARFVKASDDGPRRIELVRVVDAAAVIHTWPAPEPQQGAAWPPTEVHCGPTRCLVGIESDGQLRLSWVDPVTGEQGPVVATVDASARSRVWDLAPDERTATVIAGAPRRFVTVDLVTGLSTERPGPLDFPEDVTWSHDGQTLWVSGLDDSQDRPYRMLAFAADGTETVVWSSMSWNLHRVRESPDGKTLAVGVYAFDDDLWMLDGVDLGDG